MNKLSFNPKLIIALVFLFFMTFNMEQQVFAAMKGKIAGRETDYETKESIPGDHALQR